MRVHSLALLLLSFLAISQSAFSSSAGSDNIVYVKYINNDSIDSCNETNIHVNAGIKMQDTEFDRPVREYWADIQFISLNCLNGHFTGIGKFKVTTFKTSGASREFKAPMAQFWIDQKNIGSHIQTEFEVPVDVLYVKDLEHLNADEEFKIQKFLNSDASTTNALRIQQNF